MSFPTGWGRKCAVVIANAQVSGTSHTDFPVLVTMAMLPSEMFDADGTYPALSGGGDVRFSSDSAGATQLACEVVSFVTDNNPANGSAEIWVKVPTLSGSVDTTIYVWYDKAAESQPAVTDTYGRNAVWSGFAHKQSGSTDATGNTTITPSAGMTAGDPVNGFASLINDNETVPRLGVTKRHAKFDSTNGDNYTGDFSASAWINVFTSSGSVAQIVGIRDKDTWEFSFRLEGSQPALLIGSGSPNSNATLSINTDYRVDVTVSGTSIAFYVDGASAGTASVSGTRTDRAFNIEFAGSSADVAALAYGGSVAELKLVNGSALSSDWITTEYNNQDSPATFATAGTPESVAAATLPTLSAATAINITSSGFQPRVTATY